MYPIGQHNFSFTANSSAFGINTTPVFPVTVLENYPEWVSTYENATILFFDSDLLIRANFSDDYNLSGTIFSYLNTTHWINTSWTDAWTYTEDYGYTGTIKGAQLQAIFSPDNILGEWQWKMFANNSVNNWNVTLARYFWMNDQYPKWFDVHQAFTNGTLIANNTKIDYELSVYAYAYANWSTYGNMSYYIFSFWNTTHWQNRTPVSFATMDCIRDFNESCQSYYIIFDEFFYDYVPGNWSWRIFANNTMDEWNITPLYTVQFKKIQDGAAGLNTYNVTPCFYLDYARQNWKLGTDVNMTVWVNDTEPYPYHDYVSANFIINENSSNASAVVCQSGWSSWRLNNTPIRLNISNCLNWTTTKQYWVLQMNDSQNGTVVNYSDYTGVGYAGREAGECWTEYGYVRTAPPPSPTNESMIFSAFENARQVMNLGKNIFWIFIMLLTVFAIWFPAQGYKQPQFAFMGTILVLIAEAFLGLRMSFIGIGTFMITFVICIIAVIIAVKQVIK
jgi:hypothetical protein